MSIALTSTTTDRPATGYDSQVGFGIVDAAAALAKAGELAGARTTEAGLGPPPGIAARSAGAGPLAGSGQLVLFALLALTSLALSAAAGTRLVVLRRSPDQAHR